MKSIMKGLVFASVAAFGLAGSAFARDPIDLGKSEYMEKCAVCHGQSGKGDGGVIDVLKRAPSDLTVMSKNNGGNFPFARVYAVIDGREVLMGHGTRDMPIWGNAYKTEKVEAAEHYFDVPYNMEMYARARILALIDYLYRIQSK